ncbi:MAG: nitroreductase family deazaflavin-dependent oxidoreductase [Actinomycetota bacterium]
MTLGGRIKGAWLFTIKHTLNRFTMHQARRGRMDFAIVRTVGRKSGKTFETTIIVEEVTDGFVIELTYGPQVNWYRNLVAAHGGEIVRGADVRRVAGPVPISTAEGLAAFSPARRFVLRLLRRRHFEKLPFAA